MTRENPVNAGSSRPPTCIQSGYPNRRPRYRQRLRHRSRQAAPRRPVGTCSQKTGAVPPRDLVAMKLNALLVDPAVLGDEAWDYLERVCLDAARPRARRLHRPLDRRPAGARAAPRSRRLDRPSPAIPRRRSRGSKRSRAAVAAAARSTSRPRSPSARWRSGPTASRPSSATRALDLTRREFELLYLLAEDKGQVLERERSTSGSGATRWPTATARSTSSSASCARSWRSLSPSWTYIHTHFGIGYRFDPEPAGILAEQLRPAPEAAVEAEPAPAPDSQGVHNTFTAG